MRSLSSPLRLLGCAFVLLSVGRCSSSSSSNPPGTPTSSVIGTTGGSIASSDGVLSLSIPAGAVNGNVTVTVTPEASPPSGAVGAVYDIGPTGTVFNFPVTMTFHYASADIGSASPSSLRAATYGSNAWQILAGGKVDANAKTVSGTTMHLSTYGEILATSGEVCAQVTSSSNCGTATSGGGSASAGGTSSPPSGSSGGTGALAPDACPSQPTCATATNVCAQYPGATMTGCTDGASGFTASCCFAPSAPVCFAASAGGSCASSGTGTSGGNSSSSSGGSTPVGCPSTPTCATATTACSQFPGAKLANCTDTSDGYTGSCCFDPGTPVCVTDEAAVGCSNAGTGTGGSSSGSTGTSSGTTSCGPGPTCSDGSACSGFVGSTTQSCTNNSSGYTATCCMPLGVLPGSSGGSSNSGGVSGPPTTGGSSGGTSSGGSTGNADAGVPTGPPGDAGTGGQSDAAVGCQFSLLPTKVGSCGVNETCPGTGHTYQMLCTAIDGGTTSCTCTQDGQQTMIVDQDCSTFTESSITECGYPGP